MPNDRARVSIDSVYVAPADWVISPPAYNTGEMIRVNPSTITLADVENMLGMSSTVDIINNIKGYIMGNLSSIDEGAKGEVDTKIDRIIEALGRGNYIPTRRIHRTPPSHIVYLDDKSVEQFINKMSKCSYIKWRLASPIYWGVDHIGFEGVFKR